jgi:hypothetical protein
MSGIGWRSRRSFMAVPKKGKPAKGNVALVAAKWGVAFNIVAASFIDKYFEGVPEDKREEVKIPYDAVLQLSAGVALKIVELEDGDDAR